ncbi:DNA-processing protein DprA [Aquihabitans daechungensis]|uniref:DNA-processing protein DprA n=1 Tax=Aquihabitans daechungensis TaxID=1052257 RepID=UPI003BA11DEC
MSVPTWPHLASVAPGERHEKACLVALASLVGIGPATLAACRSGWGAARAWDALRTGRGAQIAPLAEAAAHRRKFEPDALSRMARDAAALDADVLLDRHEAAGQRVLQFGEPDYPDRLLGDLAPPALVFVEGVLDGLSLPTVAIVGTRNATRLGRETAGALAVELVDRGVSVVSGLALGIDGAAHEAIVQRPGGGVPIGVIATGLERAYPRRHHGLHRQVAATGLLLSESPIGSEPSRWRFPARNRIIAALADAVVVVESRSAGGSMLTAGEALARDRPVLAVPGHPTSTASAGTLDLIADGAVPVRDVDDVLVAIGCGGRKPVRAPAPVVGPPEVSDVAARLLEDLDPKPRTLGELVLAGSVSLDAASAALVELERAGLVTRSGAWFERSSVPAPPPGTGRGR